MKLRLPFFGPWVKKLSLARFSQNLSAMLHGGLPVTSAIEISAKVSGSRIFNQALLEVKDHITEGESISASLTRNKNFPSLFVRMVSIGEESGNLPNVLDELSKMYEEQVETEVSTSYR